QLGAVIDQLLKDRATGSQQSESFEILLTRVLRQREGRGEERAQQDGRHSSDSLIRDHKEGRLSFPRIFS
ncbi:hypothetical protein KXV98_005285, partial [Aspergillus fumigatus]